MEYSDQTRKLLGLSHAQLPLSDYLALGISSEHVNELIHMATDPKLLDAEEDPVFWAAVHAWYALGQLKATEAIGPLLDLMEKYSYDMLFDVDLSQVCFDGRRRNSRAARLSLGYQQI